MASILRAAAFGGDGEPGFVDYSSTACLLRDWNAAPARDGSTMWTAE
jgi:hypothetical protein